MCGITGWVSFDRDLTRERETVEAMTATMALRGPDDAGVWISPHAALGHRRLAVIDVEGGVQPMVAETPDGPVALTYSGEAYNFQELRAELRRRGHPFTTASDTEVVLRGYLEWGPALPERLNGMYAFAVWDSRSQALTLVRDRMGIKPLYYTATDDGVLFGSEPKAILANPLAEPVVTADGLREMFTGFLRTPGQAVWDGMREVQPGHTVFVDRDGVRDHTYWQLRATPHEDDLDTTVGTVQELLTDSITRQLVSDVPRCVLLSGGLDSSTVTGVAARELAARRERPRTFAVDFVGQEENFNADSGQNLTRDAPFVHDVATHVGSDHHDIVLDHDALADPEVRRACVAARDLPTGLGDRDLSIYLLFKAVREHSTVALSGESSDEVFAGYPSFHHPKAVAADTFPWLAIAPVRPTALQDGGFLDSIGHAEHLRQLYTEAVAAAPALPGESDSERRMRVICYLHLTRLLPVMLDRKDRMSMAVGLEARVPFCDHRIVEYAFNAPFAMKTFDGREKSLLRAAAKDVLPRSVYDRKKSGYPATHDPRYVTALQHQVADLVAGDHPALDFYDRSQVAATTKAEPAALGPGERSGMERLMDIATWLDLHHPTIKAA
jgi:asparagine synthase (glutamine-hydrolysing)